MRADQIPRRQQLERDHPDVTIWQGTGGYWRAEVHGTSVGPCVWLSALLDRVEMALDGRRTDLARLQVMATGRRGQLQPFDCESAESGSLLVFMVTTIIAIYGAVVATVSTLLGAWYFARSGPSLQAEANVDVDSKEENDGEWGNNSLILLQVWNAGRAEVKVEIIRLVIQTNKRLHLAYPFAGGGPDYVPPELDGPELPIWIPGHSGERWLIGGIDPRSGLNEPWTSATLSVSLLVGGRRFVEVPVQDGTYRRIKRRYILKPASS